MTGFGFFGQLLGGCGWFLSSCGWFFEWLWLVVAGCGWLWVVLGVCGWLWMVVGGWILSYNYFSKLFL